MYERKINTVPGCHYHCYYTHCPVVSICQYASLEEMHARCPVVSICQYASLEEMHARCPVVSVCQYASLEEMHAHCPVVSVCQYASLEEMYAHCPVVSVCQYASLEEMYAHCPMVSVCQYASLEEMCKGWGWPSRVQTTVRGYHQETFYEGSFLKMLFNKVEGMMEQVRCRCLLCPVLFFQWSSTSRLGFRSSDGVTVHHCLVCEGGG